MLDNQAVSAEIYPGFYKAVVVRYHAVAFAIEEMMKWASNTAGAMKSLRMAGDQRGPASALVEMLDPDKNISFLDHRTDTCRPLSLEVTGYVSEEKYLRPQANVASGRAANVEVEPAAIDVLINCYSTVYMFFDQSCTFLFHLHTAVSAVIIKNTIIHLSRSLFEILIVFFSLLSPKVQRAIYPFLSNQKCEPHRTLGFNAE
ncbi:hypothetical protein GALMADRAFT_145360 [Galerina marginata CBS 339.88]|uniref:Uncharacterized protein n=1 Tax=Galerina marginata (strain CBS 339.88) TaxID=685588 RepID=A0A067SPK7_GALM3|nr:hypothetical protein GALMADRAFT_145360 [Galerina marginata CBS 339.88]